MLIFLFVFIVFVFTSLFMPKPDIHSDDPGKKKEALSNLFHMLMKKFLIMHIAPTIFVVFSFILYLYFGTIPEAYRGLFFLLAVIVLAPNCLFLFVHVHPTYDSDTKKIVCDVYQVDDEGNVHLDKFDKKLIFIGSLILFCFFFYKIILEDFFAI